VPAALRTETSQDGVKIVVPRTGNSLSRGRALLRALYRKKRKKLETLSILDAFRSAGISRPRASAIPAIYRVLPRTLEHVVRVQRGHVDRLVLQLAPRDWIGRFDDQEALEIAKKVHR